MSALIGLGGLNNCIKDNENVKWIVLVIVVSFIIAMGIEEGQKEITGNLLLLAGQIFICLAL